MKILIVEDDLALSDVLSFTLRRAGFQIVTAYDGDAAIRSWEREQPDLILLDLNLPKQDGLDVCRYVRAHGTTPIIILSVRGGDDNVVKGLELGADDYVVKPFSPVQLVARVKAVLRRVDTAPVPDTLMAGDLALDRSRNEIRWSNEDAVSLTPLETRLLGTLMLHADQVLTTDRLIDAVWGAEGGDRNMLKQLVYRLRGKIEPDPSEPKYVETVPGIGYAFVSPDE